MSLIVDFSHVHRPTTGIERVSLDLFSPQALPQIKTAHIRACSNIGMVWAQWVRLPVRALLCRKDFFLCPGFPPSVFLTLAAGKRLVPYIHDMFLALRRRELNGTARYYMRPSFLFAVRFARAFLVNSLYTRQELKKHCRADADIRLLRPPVADVFGLAESADSSSAPNEPLRIVSIGTVEPRKNFGYGARICKELASLLDRPVELHIVGRKGWGGESDRLAREEGVFLRGYLPAAEIRDLVRRADLFLSPSLEEGLGLPLLEVQHGGLCVAASDIPVYREVLGETGCLFSLDDAHAAAAKIAALVSEEGWKEKHRARARANVAAWNQQAEKDKADFAAWLSAMPGMRRS